MHINKQIVVAVVVITTLGAWNALSHKRVVSRVVLGGYVLFFVLSLVDVFGGVASAVAGGIALIAMLYMVLTFVPWTTLLTLVRGGQAPVVK